MRVDSRTNFKLLQCRLEDRNPSVGLFVVLWRQVDALRSIRPASDRIDAGEGSWGGLVMQWIAKIASA